MCAFGCLTNLVSLELHKMIPVGLIHITKPESCKKENKTARSHDYRKICNCSRLP